MLSAAARAFTAIPIASRGAGMSRLLVARFMTEGGEQGQTVVDICTEKISAALETDDVKVVGTSCAACLYMYPYPRFIILNVFASIYIYMFAYSRS